MHYAGFGTRLLAYCIDGFLLQLVLFIIVMLLPASPHAPAIDLPMFLQLSATDPIAAQQRMWEFLGGLIDPRVWWVTLLVSAAYNILFIASPWQATPGKYYYGVRVVTREGAKLRLMQSMWRHLACTASLLPLMLGFLLPIVHREKAALHDVLAGTRVVFKEAL